MGRSVLGTSAHVVVCVWIPKNFVDMAEAARNHEAAAAAAEAAPAAAEAAPARRSSREVVTARGRRLLRAVRRGPGARNALGR